MADRNTFYTSVIYSLEEPENFESFDPFVLYLMFEGKIIFILKRIFITMKHYSWERSFPRGILETLFSIQM